MQLLRCDVESDTSFRCLGSQSCSAVLRVEYEGQVAAHAGTCAALQEALAAHNGAAAEAARLQQVVDQLRTAEAQLKVRYGSKR